MRPYCRQQNGQSGQSCRPQGQCYRPPLEYQGQPDPDFIAYLHQKATHYSDMLVALSIDKPLQPSTTYVGMFNSDHPFGSHRSTTRPHITSSPNFTTTRRQDPTKERLKHPFYAVHNGLGGDEIYTSWRAAAPHCYDMAAEYFIDGCVCKGFDTWDEAAD